ncbi:MBL fold metallo-hydrolase [Chakrabartyella piscis]|uniref:MBL fold metallo-hydrolase n=1 Tax=Chakrabartyella piscis TaxID=2918914 RepID=UPI002958ADAC|nr:MBL fold metallo-hydrolase [Chakrabartyella piscis]
MGYNPVELTKKIAESSCTMEQIQIWWLGQSGFLLRTPKKTVAIDLYLSTTIEDSTSNQPWKRHIRMMPIPVIPEKLEGVDLYLCSHGHRDHYDVATIQALQNQNTEMDLILPKPCMEMAKNDGFTNGIPAIAHEIIGYDGVQIKPIPAKHNAFDCTETGDYPYLGYILDFDGIRVYHAGDCILHDGLVELLQEEKIDLAILPINGSTPELIAKGFQSNFDYKEAPFICKEGNIPFMIPCHFDMFTINTEQVGKFVNYANHQMQDVGYWVPIIGEPCIFAKNGFQI